MKEIQYYTSTMFILILATITLGTDDVYILATALYGIDIQGRHILIAGPLPSAYEDVIKADMQSRMDPEPIVKVITFFHNITHLPMNDKKRENILHEFKSYSNVLKANLSKIESRKTLKTFWNYILEGRIRNQTAKKKIISGSDEELTSQEINKITSVGSTSNTTNKTSSPDDYIPNEIYYAIEKKCANWADGCDAKTPSILGMSSANFKVPLMYRQRHQKLLWSR